MSTDTPTSHDIEWRSPNAIWRATVIAAVNESLGTDLTEDSAAHTVSNTIITGIDALRNERNAARDALTGARSLYGTLLDAEHTYYRTLADRLGIPYETATDAAALCDAIAPRLAIEGAADTAAAFAAINLPDILPPDDDMDIPSPARTIHLLADALLDARRATERANEALNVAKAEADGLRAAFAATQADLRATDRARDSWRDAAGTTAKALSAAAAALADVAAIR